MLCKRNPLVRAVLVFLFPITFHPAQAQLAPSIDVPTNFKLDREIATRLRPTLLRESEEASGSFTNRGAGASAARAANICCLQVHYIFMGAAHHEATGKLNAFSSPDGTIYVDRTLANILGTRPGLWAAALSHEIAHILHRDWARRYLYEKSMRNDSAPVSLGESNTLGAWTDPASPLSQASRFSRLLETNADSDGLMLMARTGYHPDFMFSLHNLLRARAVETAHSTVDALHPEWTSREQRCAQSMPARGTNMSDFGRKCRIRRVVSPLLLFQQENLSLANEMSAGKTSSFHYAAAT